MSSLTSTPPLPLARPLFGGRLKRRALRDARYHQHTPSPPSLLGLCGLLLLLVVAILLPLLLDQGSGTTLKDKISKLIEEDIPLLFTSYPINNCTLPSWADYRGAFIFSVFNARSCSLLVGLLVSLLTYMSVFYDSQTPGLYPVSPLTPNRKRRELVGVVRRGYSISYKMVPVNGVVFSLISFYFLRYYLNVPF